MAQMTPPAATTLLGAYEVLKVTVAFPEPFWVAMEMNGTLVLESEGPKGFSVRYVKRGDVERAVAAGQILRVGF